MKIALADNSQIAFGERQALGIPAKQLARGREWIAEKENEKKKCRRVE